jgi:hypothetical protein
LDGGCSGSQVSPFKPHFSVAKDNEIELLIYKTGSFLTPATFVALDLSILLLPEPSAMPTAGLAVVAWATPWRRRRVCGGFPGSAAEAARRGDAGRTVMSRV